MKPRQAGFALLSVLLVMSVALLLTGALLRGHRLFIHSAAQQIDYLALRDAALAGEAYGLQQLRALDNRERDRIHLAQAWARTDLSLALQDVVVEVAIEDFAGRFNLNNLLSVHPPTAALHQRWLRLLASLQLPVFDPRVVAAVRLADLSQLRPIEALDGAQLAWLEPHVALLPPETRLNVNTAGFQQWLALGMPPAMAAALVAQRPAHGYTSVAEFLAQPVLDGVTLTAQGLGLSSRWFRLRSDVRLGERRLRLLSDVQFEAGGSRLSVLQRRLVTPSVDELQ